MKILVSDTEQSHANTCKSKIEAECPTATVTTRIESLAVSVAFAVSEGDIDIISRSTTGLSDSRNENEGDTAWASTIGIVHAHASNSHAETSEPSRLDVISAVGAGDGSGNNYRSYGAGLEYFDDDETVESYATTRIAGKIGQLMVDNATWSFQDARMALRQTASFYATGWVSDGGYGAVDKDSAGAVETIEMFSPTRQEYTLDTIERQAVFNWTNPEQTNFDEVVICRSDTEPDLDYTPSEEEIIYHGDAETYTYNYETFDIDDYLIFMSRDASDNYSHVESFDKNEEDVTTYQNQSLLNGCGTSALLQSSLL